jgi:hypothetical protein
VTLHKINHCQPRNALDSMIEGGSEGGREEHLTLFSACLQ